MQFHSPRLDKESPRFNFRHITPRCPASAPPIHHREASTMGGAYCSLAAYNGQRQSQLTTRPRTPGPRPAPRLARTLSATRRRHAIDQRPAPTSFIRASGLAAPASGLAALCPMGLPVRLSCPRDGSPAGHRQASGFLIRNFLPATICTRLFPPAPRQHVDQHERYALPQATTWTLTKSSLCSFDSDIRHDDIGY